MNISNEIKMLAARKGKTLTYIANYLKEHSDKNFTLQSFSRSIHKETIKYAEMKLVAEALDMEIEFKDK